MPIRVSQLLAAVTCVTAGAVLAWALWKYRKEKPELFVDRLAAQAAASEEREKEEE